MSFAGFGRSQIPFDMFDLERSAKEARRADKLSQIYHRGQELAWDGRRVLGELIERHGGVHLSPEKARAVQHLFAVLLWGEMAAWKISAQLADRLVPLEARMAATSQSHDEARHFYVMYDYLREIGQVPTSIDRPSQALLDLVLEADDVASKLMGMQLLIETLALTIFQAVRESQVEPVVCELLRYFEKDEARHVGLGVQYLPSLLKGMSRARGLRLLLDQMHVIGWAMGELKVIEPSLITLGVEPRRVFTLGMAKQALAFQSMWGEMGATPKSEDQLVDRFFGALGELLFPGEEVARSGLLARIRVAAQAYRGGVADLPASSIDPEAAPMPVVRGITDVKPAA